MSRMESIWETIVAPVYVQRCVKQLDRSNESGKRRRTNELVTKFVLPRLCYVLWSPVL